MIFEDEPDGFEPRFEIVSCFMENNGEILLLKRQDEKPQGNTWGVPAGKVEEHDENLEEAMEREIEEETGIEPGERDLSFFDTVYVRYPSYDFAYHMYHAELDGKIPVDMREEEHKDFGWFSPEEALQEPLVPDLDSCIRMFYGGRLNRDQPSSSHS